MAGGLARLGAICMGLLLLMAMVAEAAAPAKPKVPKHPPHPPPKGHKHPPHPPHPPHAPKKVRCLNRKYPSCYFRECTCPAACPGSCEIDCSTCRPVCSCDKPGAVCQDPRFIGADGITFYFHGKKDHDFCLVSDSNLHINAHFIGKRNESMGRDFTWVQALGILFDNHRLYIAAEKTQIWDDGVDRLALSFDGEPIFLPESQGAEWRSGEPPIVTITRSRSANDVVVEAEGKFKIKAAVVPITEKESVIHRYGITEEDCFAHLDLSFKFYSLSGDVSGVLGQTYASDYVSRVKMGVEMPVLGGDREFSSSGLFEADCAAAKFVGESGGDESKSLEFDDMKCASGMSGPGETGVVCKR